MIRKKICKLSWRSCTWKAFQKLYISRPLLIRNGSMIKFNPRGYSIAETDQGLEHFKQNFTPNADNRAIIDFI